MKGTANKLIQELVIKCSSLWNGTKTDFNADKAYELIERIHAEINDLKPSTETLKHGE